jgi:hypothetical protein
LLLLHGLFLNRPPAQKSPPPTRDIVTNDSWYF